MNSDKNMVSRIECRKVCQQLGGDQWTGAEIDILESYAGISELKQGAERELLRHQKYLISLLYRFHAGDVRNG